MDNILHLNEFFVEGGNQKISHVLLHVTEPSTPEEKAKGYFFALAELEGTTADVIGDLQTLIDDIENAYYESNDEGQKTALEVSIQAFNTTTSLVGSVREHINCVVGALRGDEILLAYVGTPVATLFYKSRGTYQTMNLLDQATKDENAEAQLFEQFIQGKLSTGDFVFLATPHVNDHFTADRLSKIITSRTAEESADHFERVLGDVGSGISFGGLIINRVALPPAVPVKKPRPTSVSSQQSIQHLMSTERSTSETLSPSLLTRIPNKFRREPSGPIPITPRPEESLTPVTVRSNHLQQHRSRTAQTSEPRMQQTLKVLSMAGGTTLRTVGRGLASFFSIIWLVLVATARFIGSLFFVATNIQGRRRLILDHWKREWRSRREQVRSLPGLTKVLIVVIVLACFGAVASVMVIQHNRAVAAEQKSFDDAVSLISLKRDAAESALIYRDEDKARTELNSALEVLATLPCADKNHTAACADLTTKLSSLSVRLSKLTPVIGTVLATWPEVPTLTQLAKVNTTLVATSPSSTKIFLYDTNSKDPKTAETGFVAGTITQLTVPKENDYLLAIVNNKDVYTIDTGDWHLKKSEISFPANVGNLEAAIVYSRRLYIIDSTKNRVYRHDAIKAGYGLGKDWLQSPADLSSATDMAIDGDMYVLNKNGSMLKFTSGVAQPFTLPTIDPPLTSATKMYTYNDVENVYVLDANSKRLVVFSKTGTLKMQLVDSRWQHPSDMVVDEANYTAYIIDGNTLYKVDIPH